jgi:hypothetical protein
MVKIHFELDEMVAELPFSNHLFKLNEKITIQTISGIKQYEVVKVENNLLNNFVGMCIINSEVYVREVFVPELNKVGV